MVRKLVVFLAAAMLTFMPLAAHALGFGNIKLNSALNDPLNAEIQLLSATKADLDTLHIKLASQDAFLRAGIDRPVFLTRIKFEVKERNGTFYIHATSRESIREPFVNFLLEMSWPSGRMLREYTMLLDPPGHFQKQPMVMQTPQTVQQDQISRPDQPLEEELPAGEELLPEPEMVEEAELPLAAEAEEPAIVEVEPELMEEGSLDEATPMPVLDDTTELPELEPYADTDADTVEAEALDVEPTEVADADDMATEMDPFVDDGTPFPRIALSSYADDSEEQAPIELGELDYGLTGKNDNAWTIAEKLRRGNESVSIYQVMMALVQSNPDAFVDGNVHRLKVGHVLRIEDAGLLSAMSKNQAARTYQGQTEDWEQYRQSVAGTSTQQPIVGSEVSTRTVATPETGELTLASPEGDARSGTGTSETAVSSDVVALQDEIRQLRSDASTMRGRNSELNNKLRELENELSRMQRSISIKDDELASLQNQLAEISRDARAPVAAPPVAVPEPAPVAKPEPAPKPVVKKPTPKPAPTPAEPPKEMLDEYLDIAKDIWNDVVGITKGMVGSIGGDSMLLYAGAPALVVLLVLMLLIMRRRKKAEGNYQESILTGGPNTVNSDETPSTDDSGESSFLSDFAVSGAGAIQTEDSEVDPLTEADVFMAYGRYEAAEERLQEAIQQEPGRKELKVKLLELFKTTNNASAFESTAEDFYASLGGSADSDPMWSKVVGMGKELAPANPLFSGAGAATGADAFADSIGGDPGVNLSDSQVMDIGLETGVFQTDDFAPAAGGNDLDFNLDLDDSSPAPAEPVSDALDFNLDMGSDTAEASAFDTSSDDGGLDFNLDMGSDTAEASALDTSSDDGGLDFSLDMGDSSSSDDGGLDFSLDMGDSSSSDDGGLDFNLDMGGTDESPTMETELADNGGLDFSLDMADSSEDATMAIDTGGLSFDADSAGMDLNLDASDATAVDMAGSDEVGTKLDLAKAYIDMGDPDGARSILDEVIDEGNSNQKEEAQQLIQQIA